MATLTFHGAAQEVTGSCYRLESSALGTLLFDCGMHQGGDAIDRLQQENFPFDPAKIDAVILSHAHLDHSGLLPRLVHQGFRGPIHCTSATADLLPIMLLDAVGLYERDLERENLRRDRAGRRSLKAEYTKQDVHKALKLCHRHQYRTPASLGEAAELCFHDAGHILGSAIVDLRLTERNQTKRLVFSGDLGQPGSALMRDPERLSDADLVLMESTYGDRDHRTLDDTLAQLEEVLARTWDAGGNVMIPAFAVGRTQEILFHLGCLHQQGKLDNWQVFLDSPMAIEVTKVYDRWLHLLDDEDIKQLSDANRESLQAFLPQLKLCVTPEESMAINRIKSGAIIIAGSGMCTGGRIRHHFKQRIWNRSNCVIFIGYQAQGTLGRILVDGVKQIKLFREEFRVRASVETLGGFSAHAGQKELIDWITNFQSSPRIMLIHGEPRALDALATKLWTDKGIKAEIPMLGQSIVF